MNNKVIHWCASIVAFAIPMVLASHSAFLDLTIGGLLNAIYLAVAHQLEQSA